MAELNFLDAYKPDIVFVVPEGRFTISGVVYTDALGLFATAEEAYRRAIFGADAAEGDEEAKAEELERSQLATQVCHDYIVSQIKEETPPGLRLIPVVVFGVMTELVGNFSASTEIMLALMRGHLPIIESGTESDAVAGGEVVSGQAGEPPLAPSVRSVERSSSSRKKTAGKRTGGKASRGTSPKLTGPSEQTTSEPTIAV